MPEPLVILVIVLIIFGAEKLPEIGGAPGRNIKKFKKAAHEPNETEGPSSADQKSDNPQSCCPRFF